METAKFYYSDEGWNNKDIILKFFPDFQDLTVQAFKNLINTAKELQNDFLICYGINTNYNKNLHIKTNT